LRGEGRGSRQTIYLIYKYVALSERGKRRALFGDALRVESPIKKNKRKKNKNKEKKKQ